MNSTMRGVLFWASMIVLAALVWQVTETFGQAEAPISTTGRFWCEVTARPLSGVPEGGRRGPAERRSEHDAVPAQPYPSRVGLPDPSRPSTARPRRTTTTAAWCTTSMPLPTSSTWSPAYVSTTGRSGSVACTRLPWRCSARSWPGTRPTRLGWHRPSRKEKSTDGPPRAHLRSAGPARA